MIAHDPVAEEEAARHLGDRIAYAPNNYEALDGAHALLIHTEWLPYRNPDFRRMKAAMAVPLVDTSSGSTSRTKSAAAS